MDKRPDEKANENSNENVAKNVSKNKIYIPNNPVGTTLQFTGYLLIIASIFAGIIIANHSPANPYLSEENTFSWTIAIECWLSGVLSGILFLGIGEIIQLIHNIQKLIEK